MVSYFKYIKRRSFGFRSSRLRFCADVQVPFSDPSLEQSLQHRLDFLQFTGFSVGDNLPDETTFCRFRNKLIASGKFEKLFNEINRHLEGHGLKRSDA